MFRTKELGVPSGAVLSLFIAGCKQTREVEYKNPNLVINTFTRSSGTYDLSQSLDDV
ncbi:hypothetical protein IRB23SM22_18680 [Alkalibacterium sp. s-m-22]